MKKKVLGVVVIVWRSSDNKRVCEGSNEALVVMESEA